MFRHFTLRFYGFPFTEIKDVSSPLQAICVSALFLLVRSSAALHRCRHFFLCRRRTLFSMTMAGKSQILPMDAWARSSMIERKLEELVRDSLLRSRARQN
jgi:hypothetical protein